MKRFILALAVGLILGTAAAAGMWFLRPARYTAEALLQVAASEPRLLTDREPQTAAGSVESMMFQRAQVALIKSRPIIKEALKQEKMHGLVLVERHEDPATWLQDELKADYIEGTDLLRVRLSGQEPEELPIVIKEVVDAYLREIVDAERNRKLSRLYQLEKAYRDAEEKIRGQKDMLQKLARALKIADTEILKRKQQLLLDRFDARNRELTSLQSQIGTAQATLKTLESALRAGETVPVLEHLVELQVEADPMVQKQHQEVQQRINEINHYQQHAASKLPETLERALASAKERLAQLRVGEVRQNAIERIRRKLRNDAAERERQTREQLDLLNEQQKIVVAELDKLSEQVEQLGMTSIELELKKGDVEQAQAIVTQIRGELERLQVETNSSTRPRVNVVQPATVPEVNDVKTQVLGSGIAGLCGLALGFLGVSLPGFGSGKITRTHH